MLRTSITEIKNLLEGLNSRSELAEERIRKTEDKSKKTIPSKEEKEENKQSLRNS